MGSKALPVWRCINIFSYKPWSFQCSKSPIWGPRGIPELQGQEHCECTMIHPDTKQPSHLTYLRPGLCFPLIINAFKNRTSKSWFAASLTENCDFSVTPLQVIQGADLPFPLTGTISQTLPFLLWEICVLKFVGSAEEAAAQSPLETILYCKVTTYWAELTQHCDKSMDHTPWAAQYWVKSHTVSGSDGCQGQKRWLGGLCDLMAERRC